MVEESRSLHTPWVNPPSTREEFQRYLTRFEAVDACAYLVLRCADDAIAGVFNIAEIVRGAFQSGYCGYYGSSAWARRGYMREGFELVLRHAFLSLGLHRVEANIQPDNLGSRRLVQRVGFRLEGFSPRYLKIAGRWRDHERWAITVEDWRGKGRETRERRDS